MNGRKSFYCPFQGVESYEPGCAGCDQRTFSHGSIVSRHYAGCNEIASNDVLYRNKVIISSQSSCA